MGDMLATPTPFTLCGEEFSMSEMTISDFGALRQRMRSEELEFTISQMPDGCSDQLKAELIKSVLEGSYARWHEYLGSPDGHCYGMYLATRRKSPDLTLDRFHELLARAEASEIKYMRELFNLALYGSARSESNGEASETVHPTT